MKQLNVKPQFFAKQSDFRKWLLENHLTATELLVGFYKTGTKKASITWPQSVDEALCFGWIDGIRRSIDEESYSIRFTPRKSTSIWSAVNIKKVELLSEQDLMYPMGIAAFEKRKEQKSKIYSYENEDIELNPDFDKKLKANKKAYTFFKNMPPSYQKTVIHHIMTAKQEATKLKRLQELIEASESGNKIKRLNY